MDAEDRHAPDPLDARRVLANVSEGLFGRSMTQARVGRFVLLDKLGAGGMGVVYSAFDPELDRRVAIKVLRHAEEADPGAARDRLLREARALAKLNHPNVVTVYEVGTVDDQVFLAMELVDGQPLDDWLERPRDWRDVVRVFDGAGRGLAAAHAQGLVHRDFKPSNVMLGEDGRVIVLDFGLARTERVPLTADSARLRAGVAVPSPLTETRAVVGTPLYMSPEQWKGGDVDSRSDQFSFCVSLYEALHGQRPFLGETLAQLARAVKSGELPPRGTVDLPSWLEALVRRGLRVDPEERFGSMDELLVALAGPATPVWRRPAAWAIALGLGATAWAVGAQRSESTTACQGARQQVDEVWSDARRQAMTAAFGAIDRPYVDDVRRNVIEVLDAYAARWAEAHDDACTATRIRGAQSEALMDRRMVCLSQRLEALDALTEALTEADEKTVAKAVTASRGLPALEPCADVARLLEDSPELTPPQRALRDRLQGSLSRAEALENAGRYDAARERVEQVLAEVSDGADVVVRAQASIEHAQLAERDGEYEDAARLAKEALWDATAADHVELQTRAALLLVSLVGRQLGQPDRGREWGDLANALLQQRDDPPRGRSVLEAALAKLSYFEGDYPAALEHQQRALALHQADPEADELRTARVLAGLGLYHGVLGRRAEALQHLRRALAIKERLLGPNHPATGKSHVDIGVQLMELGRLAESKQAYEEGGRIWREAYGPEHIKIARFETNFANFLAASGQEQEAVAHYRAALRILELHRGPDDLRLATPYFNLGLTYQLLDRPEPALEALETALRIYTDQEGEDHPDTINVHITLAGVYHDLKDPSRALRHSELAVERSREAYGPEHETYAGALIQHGQSLLSAGRLDEALAAAERGAAIYEQLDARAVERAGAFFLHARLLARRDRPEDRDEARRLAEHALQTLRSDDSPRPEKIDEIERWLAARSHP